MFKIECFCDDQKLAKVLWLLASGGVYNVTSAPVVNVKKSGGKLSARIASGERMKMLVDWLSKSKTVTPQDLKGFCEHHGVSTKSYSNYLRDAVNAGLLKRIGDNYEYRVLAQAKKAAKAKAKPKKKSKPKLVVANKEVA